jgi:hypothetical protein
LTLDLSACYNPPVGAGRFAYIQKLQNNSIIAHEPGRGLRAKALRPCPTSRGIDEFVPAVSKQQMQPDQPGYVEPMPE